MATVTQTICDMPSCRRVKGDANHWWTLMFFPNKDGTIKTKEYTVCEFIKVNQIENSIDLCSEECLMKAESRIRQGLDPRC